MTTVQQEFANLISDLEVAKYISGDTRNVWIDRAQEKARQLCEKYPHPYQIMRAGS